MTISLQCDQCDKWYRVADETAGKKLRCKICQTVLTIPSPTKGARKDGVSSMKKSASAARDEAGDDDEDDEDDYTVDRRPLPPRRESTRRKSKLKRSQGTNFANLAGSVLRLKLNNYFNMKYFTLASLIITFVLALVEKGPVTACFSIICIVIGLLVFLTTYFRMWWAVMHLNLLLGILGIFMLPTPGFQVIWALICLATYFDEMKDIVLDGFIGLCVAMAVFFIWTNMVGDANFLKPPPGREAAPLTVIPATGPAATGTVATGTYLERRATFQTKLAKRGPAPQAWEPQRPLPGVREITYQSGSLPLKAWVGQPAGAPAGKHPALVFFHGGFAFGADDFAVCEPFRQAGFIVMTPMLRGENGNPGNFELYFGEVDDGRAAIKWLAQQPDVDANRIYAFGHSAGGGITALLSLFDDVPLRHCGSAGGLYPEATFAQWSDIVPFDPSNPEERRLRLLLGNVKDMRRPHYAYLGTQDGITQPAQAAGRAEADPNQRLKVELISGDHFSSFPPALHRYLGVCQADDVGGRAGTAAASSSPGLFNTVPSTNPTVPFSENGPSMPRQEAPPTRQQLAERLEWSHKAEHEELQAKRNPDMAAICHASAARMWSRAANNQRARANVESAGDLGLGPEHQSSLLIPRWHLDLAEAYFPNFEPAQKARPAIVETTTANMERALSQSRKVMLRVARHNSGSEKLRMSMAFARNWYLINIELIPHPPQPGGLRTAGHFVVGRGLVGGLELDAQFRGWVG
jgi:dienelactone hydrolase